MIQINAGCSPAMMEDLRAREFEEKIDILCAQVPSIITNGRLLGASVAQVVITGILGNDSRERLGAEIDFVTPELTITAIGQLCATNCECALIENEIESFYVVSIYFEYGEAMVGYIAKLQHFREELLGKKVLYCVDANAKLLYCYREIWFWLTHQHIGGT